MKQIASVTALVIFVTLILAHASHGLKILGIFAHPGVTHYYFFRPIMRGLAEAGHDVTVISHFPEKNPPKNYKDLPLIGVETVQDSVDLAFFAHRSKLNHFLEFFLLRQWGIDDCKVALNSTAVKNVLNTKQKYDVVMLEQFNNDCMLGVAWKLGAPVIGMSSCSLMPWHYDRIGSPLDTAYVPALFLGHSDKMTYLQRLSNWFGIHVINFLYDIFNVREGDALMRKHLKDDSLPYLGDLIKNTNMMFVNTHFSLSGPRAHSPALIELGGVHIQEPKPLDEDLQKLLDSAEHGVIYVSWGSMVLSETLPEDKRNSLLKAFSSFKQIVLWKWGNTTLPNQPANVFIRKWMPQREILCHPNVRVFLTHGGLLGSSEAAYCGVPTVITPFYGDQFLNAAAFEDRGFGFIVHYEDITTETIKTAIENALKPSSQANAKKVSYSYVNRPQKPLDTAIWWVEYVAATHGAPLTKSNLPFIPWYVRSSLDVYVTLAIVALVIVAPWVYVIRKCCRKSVKVKVN